jgi:hypothetical protein
MANKVYSYTKVEGIEIGDVVNIYYDRTKDVILIIEDKGGNFGSFHHTFGPKAKGLPELINALESYHQDKYLEREAVFTTIRKAMTS